MTRSPVAAYSPDFARPAAALARSAASPHGRASSARPFRLLNDRAAFSLADSSFVIRNCLFFFFLRGFVATWRRASFPFRHS